MYEFVTLGASKQKAQDETALKLYLVIQESA